MTASARIGSIPWRLGDILLAYAVQVIGALVVLAAWWGTSSTADVSAQRVWVNVGVAGVVIVGCGNGVWLLTGMRALGEKRRDVVASLGSSSAPRVGEDRAGGTPCGEPVAASGMRFFHEPRCPFVAGKQVRAATPSAHRRRGRHPCRVCHP